VYEDTAEVITDLQAKQEKWAFEEAWPEVATWQQAFGDRAGHEPEAWFTRTFLNRRRYVSPGKEGKPNYCDRLNGPIHSRAGLISSTSPWPRWWKIPSRAPA